MEKINKIHSELKGLYSQKADHRLKGIIEVRKMLTSEQFKRFCELRKDIRTIKKERKGFIESPGNLSLITIKKS
ncbi:MAG: hypothetical protein MRK02_07375 [Candidatus Scalindua sp.]|nr:hypothetical protein [Candidatus Scalindua sp.]